MLGTSGEVVADPTLMLEELGGDHGADGVAAVVLGPGRTASVPVETGEWVSATGFQLATQNVAIGTGFSIARLDARGQSGAGQPVRTKSTTTRASSGPRSSCRKCPPPRNGECARPLVPGIRAWRCCVAGGGDRVTVAERGEERPAPASRVPPTPCGSPRLPDRRGENGTRVGELLSPLGEGLVGERRVIASDHLGSQVGGAAGVDDGSRSGTSPPSWGEPEPAEEGLTRVGCRRSGRKVLAATTRSEPVGMLGRAGAVR